MIGVVARRHDVAGRQVRHGGPGVPSGTAPDVARPPHADERREAVLQQFVHRRSPGAGFCLEDRFRGLVHIKDRHSESESAACHRLADACGSDVECPGLVDP